MISTENACDILTTRFAEVGKKEKFNTHFLRTVSLYLSDMRLIHNIVNEYLIYEERIWTHDLGREAEKQLAMIIYKNLYPDDFTLLQHGKGYVFQILKNITEKLAERKGELKEKIAAFVDANEENSETSLEELQNELWSPDISRLQLVGLDEDFWCLSEYPDIPQSDGYDLLKYLIQNKHIDENYPQYISYFYPENLTVGDKNYVLAVNNWKKTEFDYHLDNPKKVLEWLEPSLLARNSSYNYDLFEFLLENQYVCGFNAKHAWEAWLGGMDYFSKLDTEVFEFAITLWCRTLHQERLVRIINSGKPDWLNRWTNAGLLDDIRWHIYVVQSLENSNHKTLQEMNSNNWLTSAISHNKNFLKIGTPDIEKIALSLKALNVKFIDLEFRDPDDLPLVKRVYQDDLYELNSIMLVTWLVQFFDAEKNAALKKSYTYVYENQDSPLWSRIQKELDHYLEIILAENNIRFSDSPSAVIGLLNNSNLDENLKNRYIQRLDTKLEKLVDISINLWPEVLTNNCMIFSWDNIIQYYIENCENKPTFDSILVDYLEKGEKELGLKWTDLELQLQEKALRFLRKLVECTSLSADRYRAMLKPLDFQYDEILITTLSDTNIAILIELGIVKMTAKNVTVMRRFYPKHFDDFVLFDSGKEYVHLVESKEISFEESELSDLLEDNRMNDDIAVRLLDVFGKAITLNEKNYSNHVKAYIIENYFDTADIPWFLNNYNSFAPLVQAAFIARVQKYPDELTTAVQNAKTIPMAVYAACLECITTDGLKLIRKYLDNEDFELVCTTSKRPTFQENDDVQRILQYFYEQGWISSYKLVKPGIYRAYPKSHGTAA